MSGPTVALVFQDEPRDLKPSILRILEQSVDRLDDQDFWIKDSPFFWYVGEDYEGELNDYDYEERVGWHPQSKICITAMRNESIDHLHLAQITLTVARSLNGLVDFGGKLKGVTNQNEGQLWEIPYESIAGPTFVHVSDADFLLAWMNDPAFYMIK